MVIKKIAILFSGEGSNLEKLLAAVHNKVFEHCRIEVVTTICNRPNAAGIEKSRSYGIEPLIIDHTLYGSRESFDEALVEAILKSGAELTVLAGFMRFLTPYFTEHVKAINLHPSLLPLFKGGSAIKESFDSPMKVAGISVHYVSEELDGGEIISQRCFEKSEDMSFKDFETKIHALEHELLPETVKNLLNRN
ncbi:phosphoribosylglycinamide formyltransferase [Sulfurospirillum diekertiae]|uniref:Phosphoribosylglycinamide formyltransferase n=1 Tax=Sulfurospirillum diekertiae TaxID=1854492 RepID=A0A1Y0HP84_9BACT|nr:phosphoribosylglycinamide formyltransferase [Sulfurospirillum diekertiae]ARU49927.1 Phosphoribosylglycinamide formyltransferase [Sulfurospirillum diekertiae]ASC94716.1 Phosphoribosylglycinamide formyltransferase [Sulfurospirillum diekertiae]